MVDLNPRDERRAVCISKATKAGSRRRQPDLSSPLSPAPAPTCPDALPSRRTNSTMSLPQNATVNPATVTVVRASSNILMIPPLKVAGWWYCCVGWEAAGGNLLIPRERHPERKPIISLLFSCADPRTLHHKQFPRGDRWNGQAKPRLFGTGYSPTSRFLW